MPEILWDDVAARVFETGLDHGVLYLPDGSAVPWNGLTSVIEHFDKESSPIYFDGMKINDLVILGDFSATMKAVTYPDEFVEFEGLGEIRPGVFYGDQMPKSFALCYRTQIGNPLNGEADGYKIHILYNVMAIPSDKNYASIAESPSLVEFEWNISAIPQEVPGFRPTAHITIDTRQIDPWLLEELEAMLYGTEASVAALMTMDTLVARLADWYRVKIVDNGDGTWTATAERDGFIIQALGSDYFEIVNINAIYLDEDTYIISDTISNADVPQIHITDNGNGTWSASTDHDGLIIFLPDGKFEILNANAEFLNPETYIIQDTTDEH